MDKDTIKPQVLRGMRDFLPEEMRKRDWVIGIIKSIFEKYGFEPIETPAIEYLDTLYGKNRYGDEEKLIYKFRDRGRRDVGLRFDFTIPLARVVATYKDICFPFKRYQIQPVWRGDNPQYGRFREFYQCDIDIVGTHSMIADAEIISITQEILLTLGFKEFEIKINNRKILQAICECSGVEKEKETEVYRAMDKMNRIGVDGVNEKLEFSGIPADTRKKLLDILESCNTLSDFEKVIPKEEGIKELKSLFDYLEYFEVDPNLFSFAPWLARGLDYYTGPIFETVVKRPKIGSLTGGGRYDKLIGIFMEQDIPAVGTTLGFERIMAALKDLDMFPNFHSNTKVLITQFDESSVNYSMSIANEIRKSGVSVEIYPDLIKLSKQFKYANRRKIPYVVIAGPDEIQDETLTIKKMSTGKQQTIKKDKLISWTEKI